MCTVQTRAMPSKAFSFQTLFGHHIKLISCSPNSKAFSLAQMILAPIETRFSCPRPSSLAVGSECIFLFLIVLNLSFINSCCY